VGVDSAGRKEGQHDADVNQVSHKYIVTLAEELSIA
jgi:hypothetical protein